ncbi:MAG TPA: aspartate kinase [Firmicutes bacterium]|nr:aspartate kinase [Bacillota bacterium]
MVSITEEVSRDEGNRRIIVQKFGGTSVATAEGRNRVASKVAQAKKEGFWPVVVVSAMGRRPDPYATDTLLDMVRSAGVEVSAREQDLLISCGEVISTVMVVQALKAAGHDAIALTGPQAGIVTDDHFGEARIIGIGPERILTALRQGQVPVVAGFQGCTISGDVTTLGRGGSDTTASALAVALKAELVEIYTDVDGVMSADPRVSGGAKILESMTYEEICELANNGAKVVHPRAVEIVRQAGIPMRVKNTFSDHPGTLIASGKPSRVITGVTHMAGLARVEVDISRAKDQGEARVQVFKVISEEGINIDFINMTPTTTLFTVRADLADKAELALERAGFSARVARGCAKVSVIGAGMQYVPGIVARVVDALYRRGIDIMQTVDSEITISCLVREEDAQEAVRALFDEFGLSNAG